MVPCPSLLEPLSECMLQGVLGSLCFHYITGVPFYLYICLHILLWMISDFALLKALQVCKSNALHCCTFLVLLLLFHRYYYHSNYMS